MLISQVLRRPILLEIIMKKLMLSRFDFSIQNYFTSNMVKNHRRKKLVRSKLQWFTEGMLRKLLLGPSLLLVKNRYKLYSSQILIKKLVFL